MGKTDVDVHLQLPTEKALGMLDTAADEHGDATVRLIAEVLANLSRSFSTIAEEVLPAMAPPEVPRAENDANGGGLNVSWERRG